MKAPKLVAMCQKCVTEYQAVQHKTPINLFADDFLDQHLGSKDGNEGEFVRQVLYGTNRYQPLTQGMLDRMYELHGLATPGDNVSFSIIAYIAILRLTELPIKEFRRLVNTQNPTKMRQLLSFIFLENNYEVMREAWCKHYAEDFVEASLIAPLYQFKQPIAELCDELAAKNAATSAVKCEEETKVTQPVPFNITKPKPRIVSEPEVLDGASFRARAVPDMSGGMHETEECKELEKTRAENRKCEKEKYTDPKHQPFVFQSETRPMNLTTLKQEQEIRVQEATKTNFKAHPAPKPAARPAPVRMTAAAIMREDTLYKKKQEQEAALIQAYESNLRDSSEFFEWQAKMKAEDSAVKEANIEQRRLEMAASALHAMEAKDKDLEHKKEVADEMKIESQMMADKLKQEKERTRLSNQQIADDVRQMEKFAAMAMESAAEQRRERAQEIEAERIEIEKKIAESVELERQRKADAVQWQRAQEEVSRERKQNALVNKFDPTTTKSEVTGAGTLLNEMSYIEMKERTSIQKGKGEALREMKRQEIVEAKIDKEQKLRSKAQDLHRIRATARDDNKSRKASTKAAAEQKAKADKERSDVQWIDLHNRISDKKAKKKKEQQELAAQVKAIEIKRQFLNADAAKVEELKWQQLEKGAEREARDKQRVHQEHAIRAEQLKEKEAVQKARSVRAEIRGKHKFLDEYDARMHQSSAKDAASRKAEEQSKIARAKIQFSEEATQRKIHSQGPVKALSRTIQAENAKKLNSTAKGTTSRHDTEIARTRKLDTEKATRPSSRGSSRGGALSSRGGALSNRSAGGTMAKSKLPGPRYE